jgi:galactokinase/mevalonate kinase-like predicted kinase
MIRASAPGRCGLIGNPTDGYGGTVISSSLAERAVVEIIPADDILIDICGYQEPIHGVDDLKLNGSYADVAKAVFTMFEAAVTERKFHLSARTTIPMKAGLAGSTAMLAAIQGATLRMLDVSLHPYEIAELIRHIEFNTLNCVCGFQDQYMTTFGGLKYLDFRDKTPEASGDLVFATVESLEPFVGELPLILAHTGVERHSGTVHKSLRERWLQGEPAVVQAYERIARLARDAKRALLDQDWGCLGATMEENHRLQRDLGGSGEANERLISAAREAGALGAKLAGAGKGGTIIALHEDPDALCRRMLDAGATQVLRVIPSEGLVVEGQI